MTVNLLSTFLLSWAIRVGVPPGHVGSEASNHHLYQLLWVVRRPLGSAPK